MAPKIVRKIPKKTRLQEFRSNYLTSDFAKSLVVDPKLLPWVSYLILIAELALNIFIVWRIKYTEIDWVAYMQECEGFLNGTTDYSQLKGAYFKLCGMATSMKKFYF